MWNIDLFILPRQQEKNSLLFFDFQLPEDILHARPGAHHSDNNWRFSKELHIQMGFHTRLEQEDRVRRWAQAEPASNPGPPLCETLIIIIIIIIMKNFNRRSSHGHHGSKRHKLAQHAHSRGSHTFTHTLYINTVTTTLCETPAQLLQILEWNFYFDGYLREEEQTGAPREKPQTACCITC